MAKISFTASRIKSFTCPEGRQQVYLWDSGAPGLGLRATAKSSSFVFQGSFEGRSLRLTIGSPLDWPISQAQQKAREYQRQIDEGRDPRLVKAERTAADIANRAAEKGRSMAFGYAWAIYIKRREPHWSELHCRDHVAMVAKGGRIRRRSKLLSSAGPLASFQTLRLVDITQEVVQEWAQRESETRPARTRLAIRLLKAFLRWCASEAEFADYVNTNAASAKKLREAAGKPKKKNDYLEREQLTVWFAAVLQIENPVISAYLQALLLTGARRDELARVSWDDVDFTWKKLELRDKVEGRREIPLTAYVERLIRNLPRQNGWVFSSKTSASGRLMEPSIQHRKACERARLPNLTLHGLRRSFASLCEWIEVPGGISAQIQGHAPQGVREQNYIRRSLDLLRSHHQKIESWILKEGSIDSTYETLLSEVKSQQR